MVELEPERRCTRARAQDGALPGHQTDAVDGAVCLRAEVGHRQRPDRNTLRPESGGQVDRSAECTIRRRPIRGQQRGDTEAGERGGETEDSAHLSNRR
ncbi:hypothetical protein ACQPZ2_27785 [Nocardia pseudovaccinii]|uniref:hypothetical protein n=1 Tax=Nocardia pseudovaccinii TaxID=189540 RepID=UPI003D8D0BB7